MKSGHSAVAVSVSGFFLHVEMMTKVSSINTLIFKKQDRMVRYKFLLLSMLCSLLFMQSCVHGDLDDCPPMVQYAVAFEYTNHTYTGKDRFYDDVKKINLYVFDENNLVYTTTTKISPYETNFNIPLDLPMGKYHIIAWGNALDNGNFTVTPDDFVIGQTSLDDARLTLNRIANQFSTTASTEELEKLFYGELPNVEIPLYISRIDTMPLINNTNKVRVVLHWDHSGELKATDEKINYDEVRVRLSGSNAVYGFNNSLIGTNNVDYMPWAYYTTDSILKVDKNKWLTMYYYSNSVAEVTNSCVYDFSILRMITGSPISLTLERKKPAVSDPYNLLSDQINIIQTFTVYFNDQGVSAAQMQNIFDKNEYYRIDIYLTYDLLMNTYVSGTLNLKPWTLVEQPEVPMN